MTQASGSVMGLVASHNHGGPYFRGRTVPVNSSTAQQQAIRNAIIAITAAWGSTLTQAQRDGWANYAANTPQTDSLGEPRNLTPLDWYVACNVPRIQAGIARLDVAPATFNRGSFTIPVVGACLASGPSMSIAFTNTDAWASAVGGYMLLYGSRPTSPTVNYFQGPYRYGGKIAGAATPPTSPYVLSWPFPFAVGQRIHLQARVVQVDGRLSGPFRSFGTGS